MLTWCLWTVIWADSISRWNICRNLCMYSVANRAYTIKSQSIAWTNNYNVIWKQNKTHTKKEKISASFVMPAERLCSGCACSVDSSNILFGVNLCVSVNESHRTRSTLLLWDGFKLKFLPLFRTVSLSVVITIAQSFWWIISF